jgi:DUF1009 family protein
MGASPPIGLIAGSGGFPFEIASALKTQGRDVFIVGLRGFMARNEVLRDIDHAYADMLDPQRIFGLLRERGVRDVMLAGGVARPGPMALLSIYSFFRNREELKRIVSGGDDRILRGVIRLLEENGFSVIGVDEAAPGLLAADGVIGRVEVPERAMVDIALGLEVIRSLSAFDMGQGVVVAGGRMLAIEGPEGTDAMLERVRAMQANRRVQLAAPSAILVKAAKKGQDRRVDLPAIGPKTIDNAAKAGVIGIAVVAGDVVLVERARTIKEADRRGIFVAGVKA